MNKLIRTAVGFLAAAAVLAPTSAAASAHAAPGKDWTTVETLNRAKHQACKVSVDEGTAWKIYNRVDARRLARGRVAATLTATRSGEPTTRGWESGWVRHGNLSDVGTFKVPKQGAWALEMSLYADQSGTGGELAVSDIGRC